MTPSETAHLEALRTTAVAAMNACQAVIQSAEALIHSSDTPEPNEPNPWGTFDEDDTATPKGAKHDNGQKARKRR